MSRDQGPAPGDTLGGYRVARVLGTGGMGVVWEAYDLALRRQVALKVVAGHLADDPAFRARFTREARALAALDSPHVVPVFASGEHEGRLWLATQLVPDGDLGSLLRDSGPLPPAEAVDVVRQVAAGLADAHAAGVVHRDIKPANVLLRRRDAGWHAYLSDFGLARRLDAEETRPPGGLPDATADVAGTPAFMAPELHTGGEPGVASDVYAVGCLLWAALTGAPPYAGTDFEVATAHRERPVPQLAGGDALVVELNEVLRRAMAKDPASRHPSAAVLRDDLARLVLLPAPLAPVEPAEPGPAGRRAVLLVAGLVALVALAAVGTAYALSRGGTEPTAGTPTGSGSPTDTPSAIAPPLPSATQPGGEATGTGATLDPPGGALAAATASLAEVLRSQGVMTREQAECAAAGWIERAGLQQMADAGFFDEDWTFVDQDRSAMTPRISDAASAAVLACVG